MELENQNAVYFSKGKMDDVEEENIEKVQTEERGSDKQNPSRGKLAKATASDL